MSERIIYRVNQDVELKPEHPKYYEIGKAVLMVWLYDSLPERAIERAMKIVSVLPYQPVGMPELFKIVEGEEVGTEFGRACVIQTQMFGACISLLSLPVGAE